MSILGFERWLAKYKILMVFLFGCLVAISIISMPVEFRSEVYPKIQDIKIQQEQIEEMVKTINEKLEKHHHEGFFNDRVVYP